MPKRTHNDSEREDWVNNDEGLYDWFKRSKLSMRAFIRSNRTTLDDCIDAVVNAEAPAHFLKYGG